MKLLKIFITSILCGIVCVSCADFSGLEERLDSLESRIKAIENILPSLNSNVDALRILAEGHTIKSVETIDGRYKITLSNGNVIYLTQGSIGIANPPLVMVDENGYWKVDYQDGYGYRFILRDGEPVKALGENGLTPRLGIDAEGYWTIKYGTDAPERVLDAEGNPVSAIPSEGADEYFDDVTVDGDILTITLKNGDKIRVNIVPNLVFIINAPEGEQVFEPGELRVYRIANKDVATASVVAKPEGWTVTLKDIDELIVTAPQISATEVKAAADTDTDIAVLAISNGGYAVLAKLSVRINDNIE